MKTQRVTLIENALHLAKETGSDSIFLFLDTAQSCSWFMKSKFAGSSIVLVVPKELKLKDLSLKSKKTSIIRSWSGNQTRFSRIKYAFLHGVMQKIIDTESTDFH